MTLEEVVHGTERLVDIERRAPRGEDPGGRRDGQPDPPVGKGPDGADCVHQGQASRPHTVFTRDGADLTRELPLTLGEALLGAEVPVETLKGRVLLRIPAGTQNGRTFRLDGPGHAPASRRKGAATCTCKVKRRPADRPDDEAREPPGNFLDLATSPTRGPPPP